MRFFFFVATVGRHQVEVGGLAASLSFSSIIPACEEDNMLARLRRPRNHCSPPDAAAVRERAHREHQAEISVPPPEPSAEMRMSSSPQSCSIESEPNQTVSAASWAAQDDTPRWPTIRRLHCARTSWGVFSPRLPCEWMVASEIRLRGACADVTALIRHAIKTHSAHQMKRDGHRGGAGTRAVVATLNRQTPVGARDRARFPP